MATQLSKGAVRAMYFDQEYPEPVVQVIDVRKIPTQQPDNPDRYRLVVSDGDHYQQAILATQLNALVQSDQLRNDAIVKLKEYLCNTVHGRRVAVVIAMEIVSQGQARIGSPVSAEQAFAGEGGAAKGGAGSSAGSSGAGGAASGGGASAYNAMQGGGGGGGSVSEESLVPIAQLHPYHNRWTIKARVTSKGDMRTWKKPTSEGKLFSFTLLDKDGGEIRATAFNAEADRWYDVLQQGSVYYVSNAGIKIADARFARGNSQYEMTLKSETTIVPFLGVAADISAQHYNFVKIADIGAKANNDIIDVIGVITKIDDLSSVTSRAKGTQIPKRDIYIMDETANVVQVTLWDAKAESFNYPGNPVVAFKDVKVSDFSGRSLSTMRSSTISVSPDIPEAAQLKGWFSSSGVSADQATNISSGGGGSGRTRVVKTFSQIESHNLGHGEKPDWFWVRGTITYIRSDGNLWYTACPNQLPEGRQCNKKVIETAPGRWRCERCSLDLDACVHRYVFSFNAADHTGSTWLSSFDEAGPLILGHSADEMAKLKAAADPAFEHAFEEATFKTYNFRVKAKVDTWKDEERVRCSVVNIVPVDFVADSTALLARIDQYSAA